MLGAHTQLLGPACLKWYNTTATSNSTLMPTQVTWGQVGKWMCQIVINSAGILLSKQLPGSE